MQQHEQPAIHTLILTDPKVHLQSACQVWLLHASGWSVYTSDMLSNYRSSTGTNNNLNEWQKYNLMNQITVAADHNMF
jgi:hypothetical protein